MLRFEKIAAGSSWIVHRGVRYPEAFIWTTTKDDRVGPQHARKFAARLREYGIPYLFYEVTEGGHGSGANLKEKAHTSALEMTYFARKLIDWAGRSRRLALEVARIVGASDPAVVSHLRIRAQRSRAADSVIGNARGNDLVGHLCMFYPLLEG
jgi:hypothetical protein